ncbi:MAG: YtxH domain-containing protein [Chitinophagaceae bacterium]|nr:YtxH domain-containing protein [Chitinophagaceae bacterium]
MSNTKVILGFVAGAAVGALAGILFAPDEGKKTRKKIAGKAGDVSDSVKSSFNDFVDEIKKSYSNAKEEVDDLGEKARTALNSVKADVKSSLS